MRCTTSTISCPSLVTTGLYRMRPSASLVTLRQSGSSLSSHSSKSSLNANEPKSVSITFMGALRHTATVLSILGCLFLAACNTAQEQINDCLPAAIAAKRVMEKQGVPAKVLVVRWQEGERTRGHAYTIYRYGKKWSYDKDFGSIALTAQPEDGDTSGMSTAQWEAWESNWKRGHHGEIKEAYYLEEQS